jgi:hypothetical protein
LRWSRNPAAALIAAPWQFARACAPVQAIAFSQSSSCRCPSWSNRHATPELPEAVTALLPVAAAMFRGQRHRHHDWRALLLATHGSPQPDRRGFVALSGRDDVRHTPRPEPSLSSCDPASAGVPVEGIGIPSALTRCRTCSDNNQQTP